MPCAHAPMRALIPQPMARTHGGDCLGLRLRALSCWSTGFSHRCDPHGEKGGSRLLGEYNVPRGAWKPAQAAFRIALTLY